MNHIRKAAIQDVSRLAEILIFTKRMNYRKIFHDDKVSFGEMQVLPLAEDYMANPGKLENIWVYDDEFVKGMIHIEGNTIIELYVDSFFQNQGIGAGLIEFAIQMSGASKVYVLEKNSGAIRFYQRHGFSLTQERQLEEGTTEYIVKMERKLPARREDRKAGFHDNASAFYAVEYDEKIKMTLPYYEEFYKQVIDIVKLRFDKPLTWLDVGCGTGKMAETALKAVALDKFVFCDNSADMIEIVKRRFQNVNAEFIIASVLELQHSMQFDVITAIQVFHYLEREERISAVKRCYEMLNPHGIFMTFENFAPQSEAGKQLFLERWKLYQLSQGKDMAECDGHIGRYGKEYFPIPIAEHLKVLEQCGFENVEVIWVSNMQAGLLGIK